MEKEGQDIDKMMIDAMLERPITFTLKDKYFFVYPPSVGTTLLSADIIKKIKFDKNLILVSEQYELLRICIEYRADVMRFIAVHTFANRKDALNEEKVLARIGELDILDAAELLTLAVAILNWNTQQELFIKHIGLDKESKQRERIRKVKKDKSSITFGGRSLYGSLFDFAAERYGYSLEYILWGVSSINLHMMISDSIQSVYLSDKERKSAAISTDGVVINADSKDSKEAIKHYMKHLMKK